MPIFFNRSTTWALGLACSLAMLSLQGTPVTGSILNTKFGATSRSSDQALQKSVPQSHASSGRARRSAELATKVVATSAAVPTPVPTPDPTRYPYASPASGRCGGLKRLSGASGTISDGAGSYSAGQPCQWLITTGKPITLTFSSFAMAACCDKVTVYDGRTSSGRRLGTFSGTSRPTDTPTATSGSMLVTFTTDSQDNYAGFVASWTSGPSSGARISWSLGLAKGAYGIKDIGPGAFNKAFAASPHHIVKRMCAACSPDYKEVYYRRYTSATSFGLQGDLHLSVYDYLKQNWFSKNNTIHKDFDIFSSYDDAVAKRHPWKFCNYDDAGIGFPRDCGKTGKFSGQWNSWSRGGKDIAFFIEKKKCGWACLQGRAADVAKQRQKGDGVPKGAPAGMVTGWCPTCGKPIGKDPVLGQAAGG